MLYPLKFNPIYKSKVWGGEYIKKIKNDSSLPSDCGESWEISGVEGDVSIVSNGFLKDNSLEEIIEIYMGELVGDSVFEKFGYEFPILMKIIEAKENLSLQVHPDNYIAAERHNAWGKSELWYVLDSEKGSMLVSGFSKNTNSKELFDLISTGNVEDILNSPEVKPGEVYYIPSGRIHSLGKGVVILEIQQTSDVTYRVYDYGRTDRELHLDLAEDVIDYKKTVELKTFYEKKPDQSNKIIQNDFFTVNFIPLMNPLSRDYYQIDSFVLYHCINGKIIINTPENEPVVLNKGETVLIPAIIKSVILSPIEYSEVVEVYIA